MPQQQALPTWLALNNMNNSSQSGMTDPVTGFPYNGGGLNAGDYFDLTNDEAGNASYTTNGVLYSGRYRYVLVDSGATAANVKTGTVGYIRSGSTVKSAVITSAGSGQTVGSYQIAANPASGGGVGAIIQVIVGSAGTITSVSVVAGGYGYISVPTFSLTTLGGTTGTVAAQLNATPNIVTSADQVGSSPSSALPVRPVVFLNSITPGNYGFIQELGVATVLAKSSVGTAAIGAYVNAVTTDSGTVTTTAQSGSPIGSTIGNAVDLPANSILFKALLGYAATVVQD